MYASVAVFGYNRPDSMKFLLESLAMNELASESPLTIFIDGPASNDGREIQQQVQEVAYRYRQAFGTCEIIVARENKGLARSIIGGVSRVLEGADRIIVLEDDLEVSRDFLSFMNNALNYYRNVTAVGSIGGFTFDLNRSGDRDVYMHPRPCSWGWATWRDRWESCNWQYAPSGIREEIEFYIRSRKAGQDVYRMFKNHQLGKVDSWAIRWAAHHLNRDWRAVYPYASRVNNRGFGRDATNCSGRNPFPTNFSAQHSVAPSFHSDMSYSRSVLRSVNYYHSNLYKVLFKLGIVKGNRQLE